MLNHTDLMEDINLEGSDDSSDYVNGVTSKVIRCRYDGQRAAAVGRDAGAKTQIAALLDLLHLHLTGAGQYKNFLVQPDEVTLLLGGRHKNSREAVDAVSTLIRSMRSGPKARLLEHDQAWAPPGDLPCNFADKDLYPRWPGLLAAVPDEPPQLVTDLVGRVNHPGVRAYPMLTQRGFWSIRLEGLEVGRLSGDRGTLDVGKDSKDGAGRQSAARIAWTTEPGRTAPIQIVDDERALARAAATIDRFADAWLPAQPNGTATRLEQNEHALESRILRGDVPIRAGGRDLQLLRKHDTVNWGSQFPTKWGREGSARYLDALMKDGRTPWAIEMKVRGAGGVSQYYRHAIAQAVLYREFIIAAQPLHFWFSDRNLDAKACRAAVVVPELTGSNARWLPRLEQLCELFDVTLIQVEHRHAEVRVRAAK